LFFVLGSDFGVARTIEVLRGDFLAFLAVQVLQVLGGDFFVALFLGVLVVDSDRRLSQNRQRRYDDVELVCAAVFFQRQEGFVFPRQQHIALTVVDEGDGRTASAGVQNRDMLEQLFHV